MTTTIPKQETCTPPSEQVPIMLEITEQDRDRAGDYTDIRNCLVCTALKRMGYQNVKAGGTIVLIQGSWYRSDEIGPEQIFDYEKAVGKQIILYPYEFASY